MSMRTQFVNLWIDDGDGLADYGLFTHIEKPNDLYLEKRGLCDVGNLYKAEDFRFDISDLLNIAVDDNGEPLNTARFESSLEIEEGKDHRALVAMMTALHDPNRTFESVVDQYFNRNNAMAWMAVNVLLHQADATRHNFILYNPAGTKKFYFVPRDYDAAMGVWKEPPDSYDSDALRQRLEYGYAVGAPNVFISSYYKLPGMHEQMLAAVEYIRQNYLTDALLAERATEYSMLVEPYEKRAPDNQYNPEFNTFSGIKLAQSPAVNQQALINTFGIPMPPTLLSPTRENDRWLFTWQPAYELTGHSISYDLQLSTSENFAPDDIVLAIDDIPETAGIVEQRIDARRLPAGQYFARLTARASNGPDRFWQVAANKFDLNGVTYFGQIRFTVP
jgi:spore coat protein H